MKNGELKNWSEKMAASCRHDPKKALIISVLAAVLLVLWGRMLLSGDNQPARAGASPAVATRGTATSAKPRVTPSAAPGATLRHGGNARGMSMSSMASMSANSSDTRRRLREWLGQPVRPIDRNLFTVKLEYFPRDGSRPGMGVKTARDGEFWGRLEKSLLLQADQKDKRENLLANYKEDAGRLRLDSIVMGPLPKAMIDGKLVAEGEVVAAFRVLKIEPRRIIVEREGIRLEIQMK